jgi:hypothetical protein
MLSVQCDWQLACSRELPKNILLEKFLDFYFMPLAKTDMISFLKAWSK